MFLGERINPPAPPNNMETQEMLELPLTLENELPRGGESGAMTCSASVSEGPCWPYDPDKKTPALVEIKYADGELVRVGDNFVMNGVKCTVIKLIVDPHGYPYLMIIDMEGIPLNGGHGMSNPVERFAKEIYKQNAEVTSSPK